MIRRRRAGLATLAIGVALAALAPMAPTASAGPAGPAAAQQERASINGTGSSYVGLAMQQWTAEGQVQGLRVNYTPNSSPDGLSRFAGGQVDFAGTEAEFASLGQGGSVARGYQYVPDVAGAIAVMYNVSDTAGREVNYLHLSRSTVAKIFMGAITSWADPQIAADNRPANLALPDEPINVVYRAGQSGTTALFYDFVRETEPGIFAEWAARNRLNASIRIIQLDGSPGFAPRTQALSGSDQIAQFVASSGGRWSIAYDEFGYAKVYGAESAWIQNQSGRWVQPYAENISAALDSATLRDDLSQELSGVYRSTNPLAYPISAYSYMVTQCNQSSDRPTCRGPYSNPGVTGTLAAWLRYIACDGQIRMAQIGYSPLPPNLSQEIANSIARMTGGPAEQLTRENCPNPRFRGSLGAGASSPPDPYLTLAGGAGGGGETGGGSGDRDGDGVPDADADASADADGDGLPDAEQGGGAGTGDVDAAGGGSTEWREAAPLSYPVGPDEPSRIPLAVLAGALLLPALLPPMLRRRR